MMPMKLPRLCASALAFVGFVYALAAQNGSAPKGAKPPLDDVIVLPELVVSAKRIIPPPEHWSYAKMNGIEILSNASDSKTQEIMRLFGQYLNVINSVAPSLRVKNAPPLKVIICGKLGYFKQFVPRGEPLSQLSVSYFDNEQSFLVVNQSDDIINVIEELGVGDDGGAASAVAMETTDQAIVADDQGPEETSGELTADGTDIDEIPAMATPGIKLDINEQMNRAFLRLRFAQMNPRPPPWFEEGMIQLFMRMRFNGNQVTFAEIKGMAARDNTVEAREVQDFNAELAGKRLIPFGKFFSVTRDSQEYKGAGVGKWAQQCQAFVHYCIYRKGSKLQAAFGKFLEAATKGPVDEAQFRECFKMSYSSMEMEVRNYITYTESDYQLYTFKENTMPPSLEIRNAKDFEVGRLKGEALRLSGKPETGRTELLGPYSRKRTDPDLLAALGLDEINQGTVAKAKTLLETAVKAKVVRPRAYVVLGRLYMRSWLEGENAGKKFTIEQIRTIEDLAIAARTQYPPMVSVYALLADALMGADGPPSTRQLGLLVEGCKYYPTNLDLVYKTAGLLIVSGDSDSATPLIKYGMQSSKSQQDKERFATLARQLPQS